jgi:hypothetical protein
MDNLPEAISHSYPLTIPLDHHNPHSATMTSLHPDMSRLFPGTLRPVVAEPTEILWAA